MTLVCWCTRSVSRVCVCSGGVRCVHEQILQLYPDKRRHKKKSYRDFVGPLESLTDAEGLSSLCFRDQQYWKTTTPLVFDVCVEEYAVHWVIRQFSLYQASSVPVAHTVPADVHKWSRKGVGASTVWAEKMRSYVDAWAAAPEHVVTEARPHDNAAWAAYLLWYVQRTQTRVPDQPPPPIPDVHRTLPSATYPVRRDQNYDHGVSFAARAIIFFDVSNHYNLFDVIAEIVHIARDAKSRLQSMGPVDHEQTYDRILVSTATRFLSAVNYGGNNEALPIFPRHLASSSSSASTGRGYLGLRPRTCRDLFLYTAQGDLRCIRWDQDLPHILRQLQMFLPRPLSLALAGFDEFNLDVFDYLRGVPPSGTQEEIGGSQFLGAPPFRTQEGAETQTSAGGLQEGAKTPASAGGFQEVVVTQAAAAGSQDPAGWSQAVAGSSQAAAMATLPTDDAPRRAIVPPDPLTYPRDQTRAGARVVRQQQTKKRGI
ncbi:hypothetical protein U9M48_026047 [Paspalum notatum var. saurae]|uniref:Aminotransferase-like plant mobile domain-containing protein n=1 Tax=Paspalum notatum var. saurae TaxID=547442 RepID=A0AAQ3WYY7_PASNO